MIVKTIISYVGISRKFGKLFLPPKIMEELLQVRDKIILILETQVIRID